MALPSTVTGSWSASLNQRHGPFRIGSNIYVFTLDTAASKIRAYKSTDSGDTWNEQDSANAPGTSTSAGDKTIDVVQSGSTFYVAYINTTGGAVRTFTSDAWGSATSDTNQPLLNGGISSTIPFYLAVRSGGDYVFFYQGATVTVMSAARRRFYYRVYSAGAWGAATQFVVGDAAHVDLRAACLGASDRVEFLYTDALDTNTIRKQSISSTNVADTAQNITANMADNYDVGIPYAFTNGANTEIAVPFRNTTPRLAIARWNSGASAGVTATAVSDSIDPEVATSSPGAAIAVGTTPTKYVFFVDTTSDDIYRDADGGSNTYGTDVAQIASITCKGVNLGLVTNGDIGILYNDNGAVKYNKFTPPFAPPPIPLLRNRPVYALVGR